MDKNEEYQYDLPSIESLVSRRDSVREILAQHVKASQSLGKVSMESYTDSTKYLLEDLTEGSISTEGLGSVIWSAIKSTANTFREGFRKIAYAFSSTGIREIKDLEEKIAKLDGHKLKNEFVDEDLAEMVSVNGEYVGTILPEVNRRTIAQAREAVKAINEQTLHHKHILKLLNDSPAFISVKTNEDLEMTRRELDATADEIHGLLIQCARAAHRRGWWASEVEAFQRPLLGDNQLYQPGVRDLLATDMTRVHDSDSRRLSELLKKCPGSMITKINTSGRSNTTRIAVPELEELSAILRSSIELGRAIEDLYKNANLTIDVDYLHQIFEALSTDVVYTIFDEETGEPIGEFVTVEVTRDDKVRAKNLSVFYGDNLNDPLVCTLVMAKQMLRQVRNNAAFVRACLKHYK